MQFTYIQLLVFIAWIILAFATYKSKGRYKLIPISVMFILFFLAPIRQTATPINQAYDMNDKFTEDMPEKVVIIKEDFDSTLSKERKKATNLIKENLNEK